MKTLITLSFIIIPFLAFAQPMDWQPQGILVHYEDRELPIPWSGGMTDSKSEFVDIDGDDDYDCFIGDNTGKLLYFENVGTEIEPEWEFVTDFYDSIDIGSWSQPVFCDIDNDGDSDLFIVNGLVKYYYENVGTIYSPNFCFIADTLSEIIGSTIDFGDFDNDGDFDILSGSVWYFENIGDSFNFNYIFADTIMMINYVKGRNVCDLDNDDDLDLIIGEDDGNIWYLRNDGTPYQYDFTVVTENLVPPPGPDTAPTLVDIDGDGDLDLFVGTGTAGIYTPFGGIRYYENTGTPEVYDFQLITNNYFCIDCGWKSVPRLVDIDADGDLDLFIGYGSGGLAFFRNTGTSEEPGFELEEWYFQQLPVGNHCSPEFVDLDADGDYDLLTGYGFNLTGKVKLFENIGTPQEPNYILQDPEFFFYPNQEIGPSACDIDSDGDYDMFLGTINDDLVFYRNEGTAEDPHFEWVTNNYQDIGSGTPMFFDIDYDGDFDIFIGYGSNIKFFENVGNPYSANFMFITNNWEEISTHAYYNTLPFFIDIDSDNDGDLFIGSYDGGVAFYRNLLYNNSVSNPSNDIPTEFSLREAYPNPFNSMTTISFNLDKAMPMKLVVYNGLGREVAVLLDSRINAGVHLMSWNASNQASGVYFIRLSVTGGQSSVKKVMLVK